MVSIQVNEEKSQPSLHLGQNENDHFQCSICQAEHAEAGTRLCWLLSQEGVNK
jgi:hypothetical protein